jgi:hypothetical protein
MSKHYKDDIGTVIKVNTKNDIGDATKVSLLVKKPSGQTFTDYGIRYVVLAGDFNEVGVHCLQSYIETSAGNWKGDLVQFRIYDDFDSKCCGD